MIRKLNFTGRKKIPKSLISIELVPDGNRQFSFDATFNLAELALPPDAEVYAEAYHHASYMRFSYGKIGKTVIPTERKLRQIEPGAFPLFRVKVVKGGRILASADKIVPRSSADEPKGKLSLLPVEFKDLADLIWNLDLSSERPVLQLNDRIDGIKDIARIDQQFFALVYPDVIRQILRTILIENDYADADSDEDDWQSQWLRFAEGLPGVDKVPSDKYPGVEEDRETWIEEVIMVFCKKWKVREKFLQALQQEPE